MQSFAPIRSETGWNIKVSYSDSRWLVLAYNDITCAFGMELFKDHEDSIRFIEYLIQYG
jgi:hypothetical protein